MIPSSRFSDENGYLALLSILWSWLSSTVIFYTSVFSLFYSFTENHFPPHMIYPDYRLLSHLFLGSFPSPTIQMHPLSVSC